MIDRQLFPILLLAIQIGASDASTPPVLTISDVQVDRRQFDPERGETLAVRFRLSLPARVELQWFDPRDFLIRTVPSIGELPVGESSLKWDGRDQVGRQLPAEAYHYTLVARSADGAMREHDLTDVTGGVDTEIPEVVLDSSSHSLRYALGSWSRVNLRIGLQDNGPLLRSLVNWSVRGPGEQVEPWDGADASGVMRLADSTGLQFWGMTFSLPDNTVVVGDTRAPSQIIEDLPWGRVARVVKRQPPKRMYAHSQQSYDERPDFVVTLRARGLATETASASPVLMHGHGVTPIEVVVPTSIAARLAQQRFEIVYFIDGQFVEESEIAILPATWNVDGVKLSPGEHYLTVNLRGYEGTFGYGSLKVRVPPKADSANVETQPSGSSTRGRP